LERRGRTRKKVLFLVPAPPIDAGERDEAGYFALWSVRFKG
jgi:hypothetical protein